MSRYLTLDGLGGLLVSARWHSKGRPIVYCAPNPATALLETVANGRFDIDNIPTTLQYLEIDAPDDFDVESTDISTDIEKSRAIGDAWLAAARSPLLRVPGVIAPATSNYLLNPLHASAPRVRVIAVHDHPFDRRLIKTASAIK